MLQDTVLGNGDESGRGDHGHGRLGRRELLTLISSIMAMMAVGIDLLLPAFDDIETAYGLEVGSGQLSQIITVFFMGLAVAQLVYGPLADAFGRKPVLYLSVAIYMAGALISALAPTFGVLLLGRFVWGVGAAGARVVATAIIRDRFEGEAMAKAMSQIMAVFVLVPVVAPSFGALVISVLPWRSLFWFSGIFAAFIGAWGLRLSETLDDNNRRKLNLRTTLSGFKQAATTPVTLGYTLAALFLQAVWTAYLASSESIIDEVFDLGPQFPWIFGAVAILFGIGAIINGSIVEKFGIDGVVKGTYAVLLPLTLLLIVLSAMSDGEPSVWLFMPLLGLVLASFMLLMPNLGSASMTPVGEIAGTASAFTGALRTAGGASLAAVAAGWLEADTIAFSIWVAVCTGASGLCVFVVRRRAAARLALAAR